MYEKGLELAWRALEGRQPRDLARRSGSRISGARILLPFLGRRLEVDLEGRTVTMEGEDAEETVAVLALHYLSGCDNERPAEERVPFIQAVGGEAYFRAFKANTIDRLAQEFGQDPAAMVQAAGKIDGTEVRLGSRAVEVSLFPKMSVTAIVWQGDDEIPAAANLLFDEYSLRTMPTEDLALAGDLVVSRLVIEAKT